jgi:hypothetical protein
MPGKRMNETVGIDVGMLTERQRRQNLKVNKEKAQRMEILAERG